MIGTSYEELLEGDVKPSLIPTQKTPKKLRRIRGPLCVRHSRPEQPSKRLCRSMRNVPATTGTVHHKLASHLSITMLEFLHPLGEV